MAEAVHDRTQMRRRRGAVLQGREGRGHALHRQRPVQAGRVRHRTAGRRHCRRTRHAVAVEHAHAVAGMRRSRRHPERQLQQGRGTLRAESGVRLLLSPARQRPAVSEHRNAGTAAGAADRARRGAEARLNDRDRQSGKRTFLAPLSVRRFHRRGRRHAAVSARWSSR